jgi:hypothetical protein
MLSGINLTLLIGPGIPVPAPKTVVDSIKSIQVNSGADRTGFQITFTTGKISPLLNIMLLAGYLDPIVTRVIIIVTLNGFPNVLMDGLITRQEVSPSSEAGQSTISITGEDLSLAMDIVERIIPYPAMPDVAKINTVLAPYAALGITPLVIPPILSLVKSPTRGWETQPKMTDRAYIKYVASRCGYIFFIRPGPLPGQSIAYFGPDVNIPIPQSALSVNMDAKTNVDSLSFSLDGMAKKIRVFTIMDPITGKVMVPIPVPNVNAFKPPLGARPTTPARLEFDSEASQLQPDEAAQGILGFLMNNSAAISGNGSLDVMRYVKLLYSRMLVGVQGAGLAYDGMYYVDSVTHNIKQGEYKQNFTLSRDGLITTTPVVVP